jgi:cell division protein FtsW (lipid II flippase)
MRTYGRQSLRSLGAIIFLGLFGTAAAMIPIALFALFSDGSPPHWTLFAGASIVGGAAIGWMLRP